MKKNTFKNSINKLIYSSYRIFENNRIPFFTIDFEKQEKKFVKKILIK